MYYMCTLRVFKNFSFFHSLSKYPFKATIRQPKTLFSTAGFPIDNIRNLSKDVLLYTFERSRFYRYLSIFGIAQFPVWSFYAYMMYINIKDVENEDLKKYEFFIKGPLWKRALGGDHNLLIVTGIFITVGLLATVICTFLPCRIVKELTLCKGGKTAVLMTYGPFGNTVKREIPLENLSCVTSRSEAKSYISIKVKPKWFYYLIDIRGNFHNPKLFDYTLGTRAFRAY